MNLSSKILAGCMAASLIAFADPAAAAKASKKEARVTQIIRDVKLLPAEQEARAAAVNDRVGEDTGVRTGGDSRSELTFPDLTITRLGSNTIFSFNKAGRNVQLDSGSLLLRVPKDSGGGGIKTSAVTVAITGTTVIMETARSGKSKLISLEGGARVSLVKNPRESRQVRAGQMLDVPAGATTLPMPVNIDLDQVMRTSPLITDFKPLPSRDLIAAVINDQRNSPPPEEPIYDGRPAAGQPGGVTFVPGIPFIPPIRGGYPGRPSGGHHPPPPGRPPKGNSPPSQHGQTGNQPQDSYSPPPVYQPGQVAGPAKPSTQNPPVGVRTPKTTGTTPILRPRPTPKKKAPDGPVVR